MVASSPVSLSNRKEYSPRRFGGNWEVETSQEPRNRNILALNGCRVSKTVASLPPAKGTQVKYLISQCLLSLFLHVMPK